MTTRNACQGGEPRSAFAVRIPSLAGMTGAPVVFGSQPHSHEIALVNKGGLLPHAPGCTHAHEIAGVDALITREENLIIAVFTADCVPVALVDPEARLLAVAHAGRAGTFQGIVPLTVRALRANGAVPGRLRAWIAPCVCAGCYEVSPEIAADFRSHFNNYPGVVTGPEGRHLDLLEINRRELIAAGVPESQIEADPRCTAENAERFHSYRRDAGAAGRMATFLAIRGAAAPRV